ncbi:helix-turn-helix domain-containing protein [Mesorhizobium sp. L-2-11]|uniref:helix-turn-helix domain-containing protein n=1 Tax=Mesorhizobium sp. L-2-11 TaxID=2744521 RepID=UPI0019297B30
MTDPRYIASCSKQKPGSAQEAEAFRAATKELRRRYDAGEHSISDLAELFSISRPTVYRPAGGQSRRADGVSFRNCLAARLSAECHRSIA